MKEGSGTGTVAADVMAGAAGAHKGTGEGDGAEGSDKPRRVPGSVKWMGIRMISPFSACSSIAPISTVLPLASRRAFVSLSPFMSLSASLSGEKDGR